MTSHPKDLSEEVVKTIASYDKLADFIHLPVQAGSDRILSLMNRRYTSRQYLEKIDMIRSYIPDAGLSSDIMVGFPTETEEDFSDTMNIVKKVGYNNLYTFIYSRRSGTPADNRLRSRKKMRGKNLPRSLRRLRRKNGKRKIVVRKSYIFSVGHKPDRKICKRNRNSHEKQSALRRN